MGKRLTIEKVREVVKSKGGVLLSTEYQNGLTKLKIKCNNEHIFTSDYNHVRDGIWCAYCVGTARKTLDDAKILVESKGGILLSTEYKNARTKMEVKCSNEHIFWICYDKMKSRWCPYCSKRVKYTIEEVMLFIKSKNGILLSTEYKGALHKLQIQCNYGHVFDCSFAQLQYGNQWCQICSPKSQVELDWLDSLNIPKEYRQYKIKINNKNFRVDGFDPLTNTVYEFYGDFWHGNPKIYPPNKINVLSKISFDDLYKRTQERAKTLKDAGYDLIYIWEDDWNKIKP